MTADGNLVTRLRQILPDILRPAPVTLAYLYGSHTIEQSLPTSDVDIALVLCRSSKSPEIQPQEQLQLEASIEGALVRQGIPSPDVRVIDGMSLPFRGEVATQGLRLYSRDEVARVEFEIRTWKEYLDFQPVVRMMRQAFFEDIRERGL